MTTPSEVYDYDMANGRAYCASAGDSVGHDPANYYVTTRIMATAHDGAKVPVSIL